MIFLYPLGTTAILFASLWLVLRICLPGEEKIVTDTFRRDKP